MAVARLTPGESVREFLSGLDEMQSSTFGLKAATRFALRAVRAWAIFAPGKWSSGSKTLLYEAAPWEARVRVATKGPGFPEFGTRPHEIRPIRARVLAWRSNGRGPVSAFNAKKTLASGKPGALHSSNMIFAQVVHHPGSAATHRLQKVLTMAFNYFGDHDLPSLMMAALAGKTESPQI